MPPPSPDELADRLTSGCWWYADGRTLPELLALAGAVGYGRPGALAAALLARGWRLAPDFARRPPRFLWYSPEAAAAEQERRLHLSLYPYLLDVDKDGGAC